MYGDDNDLRMLGARDGLVTALLKIRAEIGLLTHYNHIPAHHKRRLAERAKILAPLRRLEAEIELRRNEVVKAYDERRKQRETV